MTEDSQLTSMEKKMSEEKVEEKELTPEEKEKQVRAVKLEKAKEVIDNNFNVFRVKSSDLRSIAEIMQLSIEELEGIVQDLKDDKEYFVGVQEYDNAIEDHLVQSLKHIETMRADIEKIRSPLAKLMSQHKGKKKSEVLKIAKEQGINVSGRGEVGLNTGKSENDLGGNYIGKTKPSFAITLTEVAEKLNKQLEEGKDVEYGEDGFTKKD